MAQVTGNISDRAALIFQDMPISLLPVTDFVRAYHGEFEVPHGGTFVAPGKSLRLVCSDGRSGDILIVSTHIGRDRGVRIRFQSTGPLQ
jgi:hypothetical protein